MAEKSWNEHVQHAWCSHQECEFNASKKAMGKLSFQMADGFVSKSSSTVDGIPFWLAKVSNGLDPSHPEYSKEWKSFRRKDEAEEWLQKKLGAMA